MFPKNTVCYLLLLLLAGFVQKGYTQEVTVINNKGTLSVIKNNKVTTAAIAPSIPAPLEGDIWFDNSDPNKIVTKIWNGSAWIFSTNEHYGTTGSVFFAGNSGLPTENNSKFFWDNTNFRLNVGGTTGTIGLNNSDGTAVQPSYRFTSSLNTGLYLPATNQIGISTGGVEAVRIDASQKVGIGISAPLESLHIANNMRLNGSFGDTQGDKGTAGQVLSSTVTGTNWIDGKLASVKALTSSYTLLPTDNGSVITINSVAATTLTVPSGLPIGFNVSVYQIGGGAITITGSGTTVKSRGNRFRTFGLDAGVNIVCTATNIFHLSGDIRI